LVITACTKGGSNGQMTVSGTTDDTVAADLITLTFTASGQTTITDSFAPSASWSHTTGGMATNTFYDVTASQTSANGTTTYSSTTAGLSCKTK
jgi:cytochrome c oxidase assembly protein Cox11